MSRLASHVTNAGEEAVIEVETVTSVDGLRRLRNDWRRLQAVDERSGPFQEWEWNLAWARSLQVSETTGGDGEGSVPRPWVVVARDAADGEPLLIWPMQRDRHAGMRRLTWLSLPALQCGGALLAPMSAARRAEVLESAWRVLRRAPVDFLDFRLLPADSPLAAFLLPRCRRGMDNAEFRIDFTAFENWRAFELALKPSARRARRKRLNRMRRAGEVRFHVHDDPRRIAGLIDIALAWKRDWLASRGIADGLPERAFFARLLKSLPRRDRSGGTRWLMAELTFDGRPVALDFGALRGDVFHAYLSAYDAALSAHSPGKVALWLMMQWCMERGLSSYDMLANPAPYKEDWANARRPLLHLVHPVTLAGQAYALWAARLREVAQHCYEALPEGLRGTLSAPLRRLRDGLARGKH